MLIGRRSSSFMGKVKNKKKSAAKDPLNRNLRHLMESGKWIRFDELFQIQPKNRTITLRVSEDLLNEVKKLAAKEDTNYQKLIRNILIEYVAKKAS